MATFRFSLISLSITSTRFTSGDFNAHKNLWDCVDTIAKGLEVATFLLQSYICPLNKKTTYIHPATGSRSSIDSAICDPALFLDLSWNVHNDLCGSDHLLAILCTSARVSQPGTPGWNMHKAGWDIFRLLCRAILHCVTLDDMTNSSNTFSATVLGFSFTNYTKRRSNNIGSWYLGSMTLASWWWLTVNIANRHSTRTTQTRIYQFHESSERKIVEPSGETYVTARDPISIWRIVKLQWKRLWQMTRRISGKADPAAVSHLEVQKKLQ